jgi:acetyl-CoA acetyltransferase
MLPKAFSMQSLVIAAHFLCELGESFALFALKAFKREDREERAAKFAK